MGMASGYYMILHVCRLLGYLYKDRQMYLKNARTEKYPILKILLRFPKKLTKQAKSDVLMCGVVFACTSF